MFIAQFRTPVSHDNQRIIMSVYRYKCSAVDVLKNFWADDRGKGFRCTGKRLWRHKGNRNQLVVGGEATQAEGNERVYTGKSVSRQSRKRLIHWSCWFYRCLCWLMKKCLVVQAFFFMLQRVSDWVYLSQVRHGSVMSVQLFWSCLVELWFFRWFSGTPIVFFFLIGSFHWRCLIRL